MNFIDIGRFENNYGIAGKRGVDHTLIHISIALFATIVACVDDFDILET